MGRIHQCVCYPILGEVNLAEMLPSFAKIGYQGVEMWGPGADFASVLAMSADNGLKVVSMLAGGWGWNELDRRQTNQDELRKSIDLAAKSGIANVIVLEGNRVPGLSDEAAADITVEGLGQIASHAEKAGVNVNLEVLNSRFDHVGYQCDTVEWGLGVVKKIASPRVKLLFDIYHVQIMQGDIIRRIRQCAGWIGHIHTAGNPGRGDLDGLSEINYRPICQAIADSGYDGFVGQEFKPTGDQIKALERAFAICDV